MNEPSALLASMAPGVVATIRTLDAGGTAVHAQSMMMRAIKNRTPEEKLLGIARASQLLGDVATARAALDRLNAERVPEHLAPEIDRVARLVADDYEREKPLGDGALLDLDHFFVKLGISRGRYPSAVLETARRYRSAAQPAA